MKILVTKTYEEQFTKILDEMIKHNPESVKNFKMYLDTILLNVPTKDKKYKKSKFFNDENVKDIEHEGFILPFYHNEEENSFVILGILKK